jgi:hypothetical protein
MTEPFPNRAHRRHPHRGHPHTPAQTILSCGRVTSVERRGAAGLCRSLAAYRYYYQDIIRLDLKPSIAVISRDGEGVLIVVTGFAVTHEC